MTAGSSVRVVQTEADLESLRTLLAAYAAHLAAGSSGVAGICLPDLGAELRALPAPYSLLLMVETDARPAGCLLTKWLERPGETACELKRLFVFPAFRGLGLARKLILHALEASKAAGYTAVYLDTVPVAMPEATRLYTSLGFAAVERYNASTVAGVAFFRKSLDGARASNTQNDSDEVHDSSSA